MSAGTYTEGFSSRSTQTGQVKSKVLNVSLLILKNGEFDDLSVKVIKKKKNKESIVITYSDLFGVLGEDIDPVSITLSCDGVCKIYVLFCAVLSYHLVTKGVFDAGSFLNILRKYQKNTVFCPGISPDIMPILPNELLKDVTHHEHPFQRYQARNCEVFYPKTMDISTQKFHCKDCKHFLVKVSSTFSCHSKAQPGSNRQDSSRLETTADVGNQQGNLQLRTDIVNCTKVVKSVTKLKKEFKNIICNPVESATTSEYVGGNIVPQRNTTEMVNGHVATKKNKTCLLTRKGQDSFLNSNITCTSKRLDQIILHLEKSVSKSKKITRLPSVNKSHTWHQNIAKIGTVRKWPYSSPNIVKVMTNFSNSVEMHSPTSKTVKITPPTSKTINITPPSSKPPSIASTDEMSISTSKPPSIASRDEMSISTSKPPSIASTDEMSISTSKPPSIASTDEMSISTSKPPSIASRDEMSISTSKPPSIASRDEMSISTSNTQGKTLGKTKEKRTLTMEPVYRVSFPNAEGRNVCMQHMSTKDLPEDQDIPHNKNRSESETQMMSFSGHTAEQGQVKASADSTKHRHPCAAGKVQETRVRKKGLAANQCPVCLEFYSSERTLKRHLRIHNLVRPYKCPVCDKSFVQKITMKVHMRLHSGEKPHQCFICARSFAQKSNMETHVRRHLGVRPFKCEQCNKSFSDRGSLGEHKKTHTGEQPYLCTVCGKCFSQRANMRTHMNRHHAVKMYSCGECSKTFKSKESLKKHMKNHVDTDISKDR